MDLQLLNASVREPQRGSSGFKRHVHRQPQLFACVQGRLAIVVEGERFALRPGMAVLVPPGQGRSVVLGRQPTVYSFFIFETDALSLEELYRQLLPIGPDLQADFSSLIEDLRSWGGPDSPLLRRTLLLRLLLGFRRQAVEPQAAGPMPSQTQLVQRVEEVLAQNLHRPLTRADIAAAVCLSEPHLARVFKAATGTTLHARLTALRVEQAKRLLRDSSLSCGQVAEEIGIASISHFTKLFQSHTGSTPTGWRKMIVNR